MNQPKIKIELEPSDKGVEILGVIGLLILLGLPLYYYNLLPDTIPIHFGSNGEPDGFSNKGMIWTLPIIGITMYLGMFWLNKYPHVFNYPQKVTAENAKRLYTNATRLIRVLNTIITYIFSYITFTTIQVALGNQSGLGNWFTPVLILAIFGVIGYFMYKSSGSKG